MQKQIEQEYVNEEEAKSQGRITENRKSQNNNGDNVFDEMIGQRKVNRFRNLSNFGWFRPEGDSEGGEMCWSIF